MIVDLHKAVKEELARNVGCLDWSDYQAMCVRDAEAQLEWENERLEGDVAKADA